MIYKFKSKAAGDVIMLGPNGDQVMRLLGREPAAKGIFEVEHMPRLIAALEHAVAADEAARNADDGEAGRLVSCFRFTEDWAGWEMHPAGAEVVVCIEGSMTLIQEIAGEEGNQTAQHRGREQPEREAEGAAGEGPQIFCNALVRVVRLAALKLHPIVDLLVQPVREVPLGEPGPCLARP